MGTFLPVEAVPALIPESDEAKLPDTGVPVVLLSLTTESDEGELPDTGVPVVLLSLTAESDEAELAEPDAAAVPVAVPAGFFTAAFLPERVKIAFPLIPRLGKSKGTIPAII